MKLEPIVPKRPIGDVDKLVSRLTKIVTDTAVAGRVFMQKYPPQVLTKTHYERKEARGGLLSSWSSTSASLTRDTIEAKIGSSSNVSPYNKFVEGSAETQVPMFRGAGWQNVDDLGKLVEQRLQTHVSDAMKKFADGK